MEADYDDWCHHYSNTISLESLSLQANGLHLDPIRMKHSGYQDTVDCIVFPVGFS